MAAVGTVVKARDAVEGKWYRSKHLPGRCVAGGLFGDHKEWRMFYIDGDRDMQSCEGLALDMEVTEAEPKF